VTAPTLPRPSTAGVDTGAGLLGRTRHTARTRLGGVWVCVDPGEATGIVATDGITVHASTTVLRSRVPGWDADADSGALGRQGNRGVRRAHRWAFDRPHARRVCVRILAVLDLLARDGITPAGVIVEAVRPMAPGGTGGGIRMAEHVGTARLIYGAVVTWADTVGLRVVPVEPDRHGEWHHTYDKRRAPWADGTGRIADHYPAELRGTRSGPAARLESDKRDMHHEREAYDLAQSSVSPSRSALVTAHPLVLKSRIPGPPLYPAPTLPHPTS
jgi:hypothetical protein